MGHYNITSVHTGERAGRQSAEPFERGGYRQRLSPEWKEDHARCAFSPEPSRREAVRDLADPRTLALVQVSGNSFWKFEGLERCGNWGNSGNLGVWRGVETGNSGNLALKTPDFQSSGNLTLVQQKF